MKKKNLATRKDLRSFNAKVERALEQLVVTNAVALKLTQKELRAIRARVARLEREARRRQ
jgi:hypothetical protein